MTDEPTYSEGISYIGKQWSGVVRAKQRQLGGTAPFVHKTNGDANDKR